jgi:hypothetical protein
MVLYAALSNTLLITSQFLLHTSSHRNLTGTIVLISILSNTFARIDQVSRNLYYVRGIFLLSTACNTRGMYCLDVGKPFSQEPSSTSFNTRLPRSKGEATLPPPLRHSLSPLPESNQMPSSPISYHSISWHFSFSPRFLGVSHRVHCMS